MRTGERFQRVRTVCLLISTLALLVLLVTGCGQAAPEVVEREVVVEKVVEVEKEVPVQVEVEKIMEAQPSAPSGSSQQAAPAVAAAPAAPAGAASQSSQPSQANQNNQADTARTAPRPEPTSVPWDTAAPGAQPMVRAAQDPVSTFSLDTDRASYQRALELANAGHEIDPADVRAEEWINSLAYGYPQPSRSEEFGIFADVFQHPDTQGMHMARIGIQAPELQSRRAVNVTLVLDSSGSMGDGNRVEIAREAAYTIVSNLLDGADQVAVVHFEEGVNHSLTVEHTRPSDRDVSRSIGQLRPGGATNVQAGLDQGLRLAYEARARHPGSINYVILFSDGVANVNATDPFAILHNLGEDSEYSRPNPIRIITIGVGIKGYNDQLLEQIAQHGNGWYRYLDDVRDAQATFRHENWIRLINAFADQARAQVTWDPELVGHWRIVGYENRVTADATFTQNLREFAEIPAGTATTVLYELQLTPQVAQRSAATARLGDIEVRWVEPVTGISREQYGTVSGAWRDNFNGLQDQMLRLGVITGLTADVYASLDDGGYGTGGYDAPNRIRILVEEHRPWRATWVTCRPTGTRPCCWTPSTGERPTTASSSPDSPGRTAATVLKGPLAKVHKIADRSEVPGNPRLQDKDAFDIYRLLRCLDGLELASEAIDLLENELAQEVTEQALELFRELFGETTATGAGMVVRYVQGLEDPDFMAVSVVELAREFLNAVDELS